MAQLPQIQNEALKWQRRLSTLGNAGLNTRPALELARTDLSRIAQGGSALPEDQVVSMVYSAYTGSTPAAQKHEGTDLNPFHIIGNVGKDLTTDVRSFIPGLVHEGADIINPHKWEGLFSGISHFQLGTISEMAKEVQALPVLGPLVPGMFALSAGWSGITKHPLNFAIDVAAVASTGTKLATAGMEEAAKGSVLEALQKGHPVQAIAKQTGLEDRLVTAIDKAGAAKEIGQMAQAGHYSAAAGLGLTPLKNSQWAYMPVWRSYNALARLNTRSLRDESLAKLDDIIPSDLSLEERQQLSIDAQEFSDRFLAPAHKADPAQIARANGDVRTAFSGESGDVIAYTTIDPSARMSAELHWSPESARKTLPQGVDLPIHEVRVNPADITHEDGHYFGRNYDRNKFYTHDEAEILKQIRDYSQEFDPRTKSAELDPETGQRKSLKDGPVSIVVPTGEGGTTTELYPHGSLPVQTQARADAAQATVKKATSTVNKLLTQKDKLDRDFAKVVAKHKTGQATDAEAIRANKRRTTNEERLKKAAKHLQRKRDAAERATKKFHEAVAKTPSSRYGMLMEKMVRTRLKEEFKTRLLHGDLTQARVAIQGAGISAGIQQIHDAYVEIAAKIDGAKSREELANIVGADTFKRVEENAYNDWRQLVAAGYNPIWVHQITPTWYESKTFASVRPRGAIRNAADRNLLFDMRPQVLDIHAQLTGQAIEFWRAEGTRQFVDFLAHKSGAVHKRSDVEADLQRRFPDSWTVAAKHLDQDYVEWANPHDPGVKYLIPKGVKRGLDMIMEGDKLPLKGLRDPVHRVFRVAVLSGPRHLVHVGLGGLVQTVLQEPGAIFDPEVLAHPVALMRAMKSGELPSELHDYQAQWAEAMKSGQLSKGMHEQSIDQLVAYRGGKRMGKWFRESQVGRGIHQTERILNNFEAGMTDWYRGAVYLHKLRGGADNEAALAVVNKALIDVDNMTPFERTAVRQIFPFWTFTKHILRYVLTYPADHPLRASILAHLAQNMEETNNTGDPARLSKLFFLGEPDASGKVNTVDFSNLNPFRSMSSVFSMTGFLSGLAPEFQTVLKGFGINTLSGTPDLHQNYHYDAYSGTRTNTRPPLNPFDFASAFIPQTEILDHFLQFTDTMRYLKHNNPEAYRRSLFQEMNLPFAVAPINIYDVRAKSAAGQYRQAQDAVTNAMRTGSTDGVRSFLAVPFQGQLYAGDQVANYIDNFDKIFPQFAPSAVMKKPRSRRKSTAIFRQDVAGLPSQPVQPNVVGYP